MSYIRKFFGTNTALKLASVLIAVVLWMFVAINIIPEMDAVISDIPITIELNGSAAEAAGLEVVEGEEQTVSVTIRGKRYVVGNLESDDFIVRAITGNITEPGKYTIELVAEQAEYSDEYEILYINPDKVEMTFDRVRSKTFSVEIISSGITVPEGYIAAEAVSSVSEVILSGTEEDLARVSRVVARVNTTGYQTKTIEEEVELVLYDSSGAEISKDKLSLSKEKTTVTISVLKMKRVDLTVDYTNIPGGLKTDDIPIHYSVGSLEIAGPVDTIDAISSINIGYVDVSNITPGAEFTFEVDLPNGFINVSDVHTVVVTFPIGRLAKDVHRITNIRAVNVPEGYTASVVSNAISGVTIVGRFEVINKLADEDLVAEIDLSAVDFVQGYNTLRVQIKAGGQTAFANGIYTAIVYIEKK